MPEIDMPHLVAQHYDDGAFGYLTPKTVRTECDMVGDSLFAYAVKEAGDSSGLDELIHMLGRAEEQLRDLREKLDELRASLSETPVALDAEAQVQEGSPA